jgi:hypothetical protein
MAFFEEEEEDDDEEGGEENRRSEACREAINWLVQEEKG